MNPSRPQHFLQGSISHIALRISDKHTGESIIKYMLHTALRNKYYYPVISPSARQGYGFLRDSVGVDQKKSKFEYTFSTPGGKGIQIIL